MVEIKVIKAIQAIQPNVTFMVSNQNSPVPEHVFCEVYSIGDSFAGTPEFSNDEYQETISTVVKHKVSLTYHGLINSGAQQAALYMSRYLESFQARLSLKEQGLSLIKVDDIQRTPILKDVDMYTMYVLDILVATDESDSFGIDVIDSVQIHGDFSITEYDLKVEI